MNDSDAQIFESLPVPSLSVDNMINLRCAAMERYKQAIELLAQAQELCERANCEGIRLEMEKRSGRCERVQFQNDAATLDSIQRDIDFCAWNYLMDQSGLRTFMDAKARAEWNRDLRELETIPEFTKQNVDATFFNVHMQRQDFFERGVIECFRNLSWDHKTNSPFKFGKRIIINGLYRLWGTGKNKWLSWNDDKGNHLDDLIRVFSILDGKPEPDHRQNLRTLIDAADTKKERAIEHKYFALKWYLKGTAHLTFKRLDLVERMNNILAKQYPRALPDASI